MYILVDKVCVPRRDKVEDSGLDIYISEVDICVWYLTRITPKRSFKTLDVCAQLNNSGVIASARRPNTIVDLEMQVCSDTVEMADFAQTRI